MIRPLLRCAVAGALAAVPLAAAESGLGQLVEQFNAGGRTMWFLLALSVVAVAFTIERVVRFRPSRIVPRGLADGMRGLWKAGDHAGILARCRADGSCLARIIVFIVEHRVAPPEMVAANAADIGAREIRPHLAKVAPLAVVAALAPLFGLFGTVYGMMESFEQFRLLGETGDPSVFAGSISLALITTAAGLIVCMPAIAVHHLLRAWITRTSGRLEDEVSELINDWLVPAAPAAPAAA